MYPTPVCMPALEKRDETGHYLLMKHYWCVSFWRLTLEISHQTKELRGGEGSNITLDYVDIRIGGERMNKVNETIEVLCNWIQTQLADGKGDTSHQVSEMVKALAELVSASA